MDRREHWQQVYTTKARERLGWFKPHLDASLAWIADLRLPADAAIIDVGGGASTLVDDLLDEDYASLTVLDISEPALSAVRGRLGADAERVTWVTADVTEAALPADAYDLWHDRAVFHFLTDAADRERYSDRLKASLRSGGHLIIGAFAPDAPPRCSGLPVERYTVAGLAAELGSGLELCEQKKDLHVTPGGVEQMYQYCLFRRV